MMVLDFLSSLHAPGDTHNLKVNVYLLLRSYKIKMFVKEKIKLCSFACILFAGIAN